MKVVLQRVSQARVLVDGAVTGSIDGGLCLLIGVAYGDTEQDVTWMAEKVANLRIFEDGGGKLNLSVLDIGGSVLAVSQFTLLGDCSRGRRPSFTDAAPPEEANRLYRIFVDELIKKGLTVEEGVFRATMEVELSNSGPVTMIMDSRKTG